MMTNYQGKVLIAHPNMPNDNIFSRSVVYIYQDDAQNGTIGLILNKKSNYRISDVCNEKGIIFGDMQSKIYKGGPVNQQALILLHTSEWGSTNTTDVRNNLCVSSDDTMLAKIGSGNQPHYWRLFGGMSAWMPGQLDAEMQGRFPFKPENSWLIANLTHNDIFEYTGDKQWQVAFELCSKQMYDQYF
jgi:putative transcriptional regulator|tara:strand:+ start:2588 stop:3148 length:561 start_codon:yes stop_codon:yes gene_type:complete